MSNENVVCSQEISELYDLLNKEYRYMINMKDEYIDNLHYVACQIRSKFTDFGYSDEMISDMLVEYLYNHKKRYKQLLWFCYGQYIVNNLENNITVTKTKFVQCIDCGEWIEVDARNMTKCRCDNCQKEYRRLWDRERKSKK